MPSVFALPAPAATSAGRDVPPHEAGHQEPLGGARPRHQRLLDAVPRGHLPHRGESAPTPDDVCAKLGRAGAPGLAGSRCPGQARDVSRSPVLTAPRRPRPPWRPQKKGWACTRQQLNELRAFKRRVLSYPSCAELLLDDFLRAGLLVGQEA